MSLALCAADQPQPGSVQSSEELFRCNRAHFTQLDSAEFRQRMLLMRWASFITALLECTEPLRHIGSNNSDDGDCHCNSTSEQHRILG